ncbi:AbiH family protein [Acinetobacter sp. YH16042]|uniref:AbiH family protein n=1 Tax=Acinetobacter sp. YH16042 TaxID=2601186 RepID=UPI0015D2BDE6|nr:AbiH family protein [Acinetobacter sp. YH16042]
MNILIVGNGFDLSHYLPTKYDHFMDVMDAIETHTGDTMSFEELFSKCRENWFINKTKEFYKTEIITLEGGQLNNLKNLLKENSWYSYFKNHVQEIKTWIDFELKINDVLKVLASFLLQIEKISNEQGLSSKEIFFSTDAPLGKIFLTIENCHILELLKITKSGYYAQREFLDEEFGIYYQMTEVYSDDEDANFKFYIANDNVQYQHGCYKVKIDKIMSNLHQELENFVEIFNKYLELIVTCLEPKRQLITPLDYWINPDKILSFNYTNTYKRLYDYADVEFLHGSHGEKQNIVLGVSDLDDDALKKLKAYGFTKYHQKLFKDTDYLFLDVYKNKILSNRKSQIDLYEQLKGENRSAYRNVLNNRIKNSETMLDLNFYIWGHSLDISDKDYIIDLFSLNDDMDRNVRVVIYHYDKTAKFSLLNNLLAILGKDKVEQWMKNKWLEFKPNPEVKFEVDSNLEEAS